MEHLDESEIEPDGRSVGSRRALRFRPTLADHVDALVDRIDSWRDRPVVVTAGLAGSAVLVVLWWLGRTPPPPSVEAAIPRATSTVPGSAPTPSITIGAVEVPVVVVHVAGAVRAPGVYELPDGSRILDAIEAAGGATADADLDRLNLAAPVADGMQVRVPTPEDAFAVITGASDAAEAGPVDLNVADAAALDALPGVGPATAAAIVAHREEHGPFGAVEDLLDVTGIGPAKLAALADLVVVS